MICKNILTPLILVLSCLGVVSGQNVADKQVTKIRVSIPENPVVINPMIYGQMLEDCNDRIIYDGVVDRDGSRRPHVDNFLKELSMPIVRWPGGTFVREYKWKRGIGPMDERPTVKVHCWGGVESHRFGTDEFLDWCKRVGSEPYINLNINPHPDPEIGGTLEEALDWIEYVNGDIDTPYGKKRKANGHPEPYNVRYWGIGNEDWSGFGRGVKMTAEEYADLLDRWASAIRARHPDLQLMGVGYRAKWDDAVLAKCAGKIDWMTHHYYANSRVVDQKIVDAEGTLFAPAIIEAHLAVVGNIVEKYNELLKREENPIRISIDEWNTRHSVVQESKKAVFTRHDPRRQFDVAVVAGTLNVFIRQSPTVGMGNYIFPVNGHGAVRTVGDDEAYTTAIYPIFNLYRKLMTGHRMDVAIEGPGVMASQVKFNLSGDGQGCKPKDDLLPYIDSTAMLNKEGKLCVAFVNRSHETSYTFTLDLPDGYTPIKSWRVSSDDINLANTDDKRDAIRTVETTLNGNENQFTIAPCGFLLIESKKAK